MKRLLSILLALTLMITTCAPAYGEAPLHDTEITVTGKDDAEINELLQIINEEEKNGSNDENGSQNAEGIDTGSSENVSEDDEFMDILKKRAEGKNDEVE